jgi:hypothetical protein
VPHAEAFLSCSYSRFSAVSEPFLDRKYWKIGFLGCSQAILALHDLNIDLKPVLATGKPTENGGKAP